MKKRKKGDHSDHLQRMVLLLEIFIFIRVAVGELVYLYTVLLNLLSDLQRQKKKNCRKTCLMSKCE